MDKAVFDQYVLVGRLRADLIEGKASVQIVGPAGDVEMSDLSQNYEEKVISFLDVYWMDLRRQIRDQLGADEAEQLIDNATEGINNGKMDN